MNRSNGLNIWLECKIVWLECKNHPLLIKIVWFYEDNRVKYRLKAFLPVRELTDHKFVLLIVKRIFHFTSLVLNPNLQQVLSKPSLEDEDIRNFFKEVGTCIDRSNPLARLDFLSCPVILSTDWQDVVADLGVIVEVCNCP